MEIRMDYFPFWLRYAEEWETFNMTAEQIGKLVLSAAAYVREGSVPDFSEDMLCMIVWTYMQKDLDSAQERYAIAVENGRKHTGKRKKKQTEPDDNQDTSKTNQDASKTNPEEPITESESKAKTKSISISISKSKTKSETESATESTATAQTTPTAASPGEALAYGTHGWVRLTPEEHAALARQMGRLELDHYIRCTDAYIERSKNAAGYQDWKNLILRFFREKMFHSTLQRTFRTEP